MNMKAIWVIVGFILTVLSGCGSKNTTNSNIIPAPYSYHHPTWGMYRNTSKQEKNINKDQTVKDKYYRGYHSQKNL